MAREGRKEENLFLAKTQRRKEEVCLVVFAFPLRLCVFA
jgi:hypothetical protein